ELAIGPALHQVSGVDNRRPRQTWNWYPAAVPLDFQTAGPILEQQRNRPVVGVSAGSELPGQPRTVVRRIVQQPGAAVGVPVLGIEIVLREAERQSKGMHDLAAHAGRHVAKLQHDPSEISWPGWPTAEIVGS